MVVLALTASYAHRAGDFAGYLLVGNLALAGRDIYHDAPVGINTWPPFFSLLCVPLALLARVSLVGSRVVWLLLNWVAVIVALGASVRMAWNRRLSLREVTRSTPDDIDIASSAAWLPLLLCIRWILANLEHLQINIIIFVLVLLGLLQHRAGRDGRAGALIGLAAALKVLPVLFIPYFLWRRQWRAWFATTLATLGFTLLPVLIYGSHRFASQWHSWMSVLHGGQGTGKMNLSVYAMIDRTLGHHIIPFTVAGTDNLPPSHSELVRLVTLAALAGVTGLACWLFRGRYRPESRDAVAEWSIVLLVGSLFGPLTWKPYLVVTLLPLTLFVASWRDPAIAAAFRARLRLITWLDFALGLAAADVLVGTAIAQRLEMGSLLTIAALVFLATLYWYRARLNDYVTTST